MSCVTYVLGTIFFGTICHPCDRAGHGKIGAGEALMTPQPLTYFFPISFAEISI
jgi:hypothetical protein